MCPSTRGASPHYPNPRSCLFQAVCATQPQRALEVYHKTVQILDGGGVPGAYPGQPFVLEFLAPGKEHLGNFSSNERAAPRLDDAPA